MHPNSNEASGMRPISFMHVQDVHYMKALCWGHNPCCLIFWRTYKSSQNLCPILHNLELAVDLSNLGPRIGVIYKFLLNQKMRFRFQIIILEFSLHTIKQEIQGIMGGTRYTFAIIITCCLPTIKIDCLEYPPTSSACEEWYGWH
jgi:hypothetical protein